MKLKRIERKNLRKYTHSGKQSLIIKKESPLPEMVKQIHISVDNHLDGLYNCLGLYFIPEV